MRASRRKALDRARTKLRQELSRRARRGIVADEAELHAQERALACDRRPWVSGRQAGAADVLERLMSFSIHNGDGDPRESTPMGE